MHCTSTARCDGRIQRLFPVSSSTSAIITALHCNACILPSALQCMHSAFCASVSQICRGHDTKTLLRTHSRNSFPVSESTHYSAFRKSHVCGVPTGGAGRPRGARGQALATTVALDADIHSAATIPPSTLTLALLLLPLLLSFCLLLVTLICYTHHSPCSLLASTASRLLTTTDGPDTITNTPPPITYPPRADLLIPD